MNKNVVLPSKAEVEKMLSYGIKHNQYINLRTVGELLGCKWIDSLLPKIDIEPKWGYEGLKVFFENHNITSIDTLETALEKVK